MSALNLPNTLTALRIVLIPLFVTAVIYRRHDYALYLFAVAALTDAFDGLIARLKNQKTALGNFLDPLADKFLLTTSFILFSIFGLVPLWLTITIISRDVIITTGWVVLYLLTHTSRVAPSVLGKSAIALQLFLIGYILLDLNVPRMPDLQIFLIPVTATLTILSGLHYLYRGLIQSNVS